MLSRIDSRSLLGVRYSFASPSGEAVDGPAMARQEGVAFGLPLPVCGPPFNILTVRPCAHAAFLPFATRANTGSLKVLGASGQASLWLDVVCPSVTIRPARGKKARQLWRRLMRWSILLVMLLLLGCQKSSIGASVSDPSSYDRSGKVKLKTPF